MKNHKGIIVCGEYSLESAIDFKEYHKDNLEKLGYYLIIVHSNESYVKLLSVENVTETDLKDLLSELEK